jgi:hypothetical protein
MGKYRSPMQLEAGVRSVISMMRWGKNNQPHTTNPSLAENRNTGSTPTLILKTVAAFAAGRFPFTIVS